MTEAIATLRAWAAALPEERSWRIQSNTNESMSVDVKDRFKGILYRIGAEELIGDESDVVNRYAKKCITRIEQP